MVMAASLRMAVGHAHACGPACDGSSAVAGWQSWQQNAVAKVGVVCARRVELPAMRPVTGACLVVWGAWGCWNGRLLSTQPSVCGNALAASRQARLGPGRALRTRSRPAGPATSPTRPRHVLRRNWRRREAHMPEILCGQAPYR